MMSVPGPSCRLSVQGVNPPVCCVLDDVCKGQFCGFTQCAVSSRGGGPRHIGTGTSLTVSSLWHCLGHSQASLQCHFSRCKVGSLKGLRVRIVLVDAFTDLMRCRK